MSTIEILASLFLNLGKEWSSFLAVVFKASRYDFPRYLMRRENIALEYFPRKHQTNTFSLWDASILHLSAIALFRLFPLRRNQEGPFRQMTWTCTPYSLPSNRHHIHFKFSIFWFKVTNLPSLLLRLNIPARRICSANNKKALMEPCLNYGPLCKANKGSF